MKLNRKETLKMINLSRALKEKKRLIGRINDAQAEIRKYNIFEKENVEAGNKTDKVDISDVYKALKEDTKKLYTLKAKISKANAESGINLLVYEMEENKNFLNFLGRVPEDVESYRVDLGEKKVLIEREAQLDRNFLKAERESIKARIEELQDMIDERNAIVKVDYEI